MVEPDDLCMICNKTREMHGDMNHKFSEDGQLIPIEKRPEPRVKPPRHRDDPLPPTEDARAIATLVEVLIEKDVLDAKDVLRIFKGNG